jgi:hypothetical protein
MLSGFVKKNHKHFSDRGSVDQISIDLFTWSNFLIKRLKISQLIEKLDQLPKNNLQILAVDQNFNNVILSYFKLSIKCQNLQVIFWQLIESF